MRRAFYIFTGILLVLIIILVAAHEIIEARIFRIIQNQPGFSITYKSRHGSLFSGYIIKEIVFRSQRRETTPPGSFSTSSLQIRWNPFSLMLTRISWDKGNLSIQISDAEKQDIPIGQGEMILSKESQNRGWLTSTSPITIGPDEWRGKADLKIHSKLGGIETVINIQNLPSKLLMLGEPPQNFTPLGNLSLYLKIDGSLSNPQASGTLTDNATGQSFRF